MARAAALGLTMLHRAFTMTENAGRARHREERMASTMHQRIRTVVGDIPAETTGYALIHEHLFCDLRPLAERLPLGVAEDAVMAALLPPLEEARRAGAGLLLEPTPPGIGRHPLLYRRLSRHSGVQVIASTGLYKEPLLPAFAYTCSVEELADWMTAEIQLGISPEALRPDFGGPRIPDLADPEADPPVRAGVIKLAISDHGLQEVEARALRAAVRAATRTGAAIISHAPHGPSALAQLDELERAGGDPSRFTVVHAHAEPDFAFHLAYARRGAWVEYDAIGSRPDTVFVELVLRMLDAGYAGQLLLSQDVVGWRHGVPEGGAGTRRFAYLFTHFVPALHAAGVDQATIDQLLRDNPRRMVTLRRPA
jgi:phosphotriesterase-related protein